MNPKPMKKRSEKPKASTGSVIINSDCFKAGKLYRVKLAPGSKVKLLSKEEAIITIKGGKDAVGIRIRCGCSDPPGAGCRMHIEGRWIVCAPTVCESCDMAISSWARD